MTGIWSGRRGVLAATAGSLMIIGAVAFGVALYGISGPPPLPKADMTADPRLEAEHPLDGHLPYGVREKVLPRSAPTGVEIPSIGVRGKVFSLGLQSDGTLAVPPLNRVQEAGWYENGPAPGQRGPAVINGHVDSKTGPGVFYRLGAVKPGARVVITRGDRKTAVFKVSRIEKVAKNRFPTDRVYGHVAYPALRLITCGGPFDRRTGHYRDNIIVYGVPVG